MQEVQKDCTSPFEEDDTDSSCTSKSSISKDHRDDAISESEDSLHEEAVLPGTDRVNSGYPREFGYTNIYQVEEGLNGNAGVKIAIPKVSMYLERGKELQDLNLIEHGCLIQTKKKKTEKDDHVDDHSMDEGEAPDDLPRLNTKKRGRQSSSRFEYNTSFEMQRLFEQVVATKQSLPFIIGKAPPKRPGSKPLPLDSREESAEDYTKRLDGWQREADIFAAYYLLLFRPTSSRNFKESEFTFDALESWITDCRTSKNWLKEGRLAMFNSRLNGMSISSTNKQLITAYRGRCRTIWTEDERNSNKQYFAYQHARRAEDLEASDLTDVEYNLQHVDLGSDFNKKMKKQELDISNIQKALEKLLPPLPPPPSRMAPLGTATNNTGPINLVGQQVATEHRLDMNVDLMEAIYSGDNAKLNVHLAPVSDGGLNSKMPTEVEPGPDPTNSQTHKLESDQAVVFDEVVRLMLQGNEGEERRPRLVLGPAGTGKTRLIFAILDAARSKGKEFICTSFNAITATAIGGDTFSGDFLWHPEAHQRESSKFSKDDLIKFLHNHGFGIDSAGRDFNEVVVGITLEEISTFSPEMISLLDIRLRQVTGKDRPFGGLILLMVGDFGQLGPVEATAIPNAVVDLCQFHSDRNSRTEWLLKEKARQKNNKKRKNKNLSCSGLWKKTSLPSATEEIQDRHSEGHPYRRGIDLLTSAKLFRLTTQKRAQDAEHRKHVESMFRGEKLTFPMFNLYEELKATDLQEGGDFLEAPFLCSTNRERATINGIMAPIRASAKGVCAIRWGADLKGCWDQKPEEKYIQEILDSDPCFWEYFVQGSEGYLTDNMCKRLKLVNGTRIRYHSLSFDSHEKHLLFHKLVAETEVGKTLSLPLDLRPETVNVELIDLSKESQQEWLRQSLSLLPDKVVIPLSCHRKSRKMPRRMLVPGGPNGKYKCSKVRVRNFFPVEPGFAITVYKAQGRTLPKVILAVSERKGNGCGLDCRSIYVAFSRVKRKEDIRLLLFGEGGHRDSITYLTKLKADPCNLAFIEGFNGGKFNCKRVLDKYEELAGKPRSSSTPSKEKRKRN